jgi:tellurite resistance protein TerC
MDTGNLWLWVGFTIFVLGMLALDLGVFHRSAHAVSLREAGIWSAIWITLALVFNAIVYAFVSPEAGLQFLTGYLIEKSLSVDNIFVFVLIFSYFSVPAMYQHRVLFWGIFGALVMRAILIATGAALIERFHWVIYIFGAFLIFTGIRMAFHKDEELHPDDNPVVKLFKRFMPVTKEYHGQSFFVRHAGKLAATPLFVVLLLVESTDLFAILGLRALYFLLAGVMDKFRYLKIGLSIVLVFVGAKMLAEAIHIEIPIGVSLGVIAAVITGSVLASLWKSSREAKIETIDAGRHSAASK